MIRLCTICARGGSRGVKGKNIRMLSGKPLIAFTIEQARASGLFSVIALSSESDEILDVGQAWGVDEVVKRPVEMATDTAAKVPVIRHCAVETENRTGHTFDTIVDLAVTSPFRSVEDIRGAVHMLETKGITNVGSGSPAQRSPYYNIVELDNMGRVRYSKLPDEPIYRRQDAPKCFDLNGAIYAWKRNWLLNGPDKAIGDDTLLYVMPLERSLDIDSELDFRVAELQMEGSA